MVESPVIDPAVAIIPEQQSSVYTLDPVIPFSIYILLAAAPSLLGRKEESVERLSTLVRCAKEEMWAANRAGKMDVGQMWMERVQEVGGMLAVLLLDLNVSPFYASNPHRTDVLLSSVSRIGSQPPLVEFVLQVSYAPHISVSHQPPY